MWSQHRGDRRLQSRPMRSRLLIIAALIAFSLAGTLRADLQIDVSIGWQGAYRGGRWTPIYVTATDNKPRQVILELYAPADQNYAMKVRQSFPIGPTPVTRALYVPLMYSLHQASITLHDANTLRRLGTVELDDFAQET